MYKSLLLAIYLALFVGFFAQDAYADGNNTAPPGQSNGPPDNRPPDNRPPDKECKNNCDPDTGDVNVEVTVGLEVENDVSLTNENDITLGVSIDDRDHIDTDVNVAGDDIDVTATGGHATATGGQGGSVVIEDGAITTGDQNVEVNVEGDEILVEGDEINQSQENTQIVGDTNVSVYNVHNAAKRVAGAMYIGSPDFPTSILYNATADAAEKGAYVRQEYVDVCNERHTRRNPIETQTWQKNDVRVQFTNHQNYAGKKKLGLDVPVSLVQPYKTGPTVHAQCLGLALVDSVEKKESLALGEVESKLYEFVEHHLGQCSSEIYLFSFEDTMAFNRGVDTRSGAWNALSSVTNIINDGTGGLGGGANMGRSGAFGRVQLGNTYWVLCKDPQGVAFDFGIPEEVQENAVSDTVKEELDPPMKEDVSTPPESDVVKQERSRVFQPNKVKPAEFGG